MSGHRGRCQRRRVGAGRHRRGQGQQGEELIRLRDYDG